MSDRVKRIQDVIEYVCFARGVKVRDVLASDRGPRTVSGARAVICVLLAELASLDEIGRILSKRSGNTVFTLGGRMRERLGREPELANEVEGFARALGLDFKVKGDAA